MSEGSGPPGLPSRTPPQGSKRSLLVASALVSVALAATQWAGSAPPVLTGSDRLMTQYESLRAHVARGERHDLIVFGNSVARQSVDVVALQERLAEELGRPFSAFNFGAGGACLPVLPLAAELVYGVEAPTIALVVVTPRMASSWSEDREQWTRLVRASPYGRAIGDDVRWRGACSRWLLDHVAAYGLRARLAGLLLGRPHFPRERGGYDAARGFGTWPPQGPEVLARQRAMDRSCDWTVGAAKEAELVELVRALQARAARVLLVEAAVRPERLDTWRREGIDPALAALLGRVAERTGATALFVPPELGLSAADFNDLLHLTSAGAARYTAWLAKELASVLADEARRAEESGSGLRTPGSGH